MTRFYAVLERQQTKGRGAKSPRHPDDLYVLVKDGFSWPAFFFGPLWALANRMWVVGALLIVVLIGIGMLTRSIDGGDALQQWLLFGLAVLLGFHGNDLRQWSLERSGYELSAIVGGTDITDAERRLFASMGSMMFGR